MSQGLDAVSSKSLVEYTKYGEVVTSGKLQIQCKTCVKRPLNRQNKDLYGKRELNEGRKYCRMLPLF